LLNCPLVSVLTFAIDGWGLAVADIVEIDVTLAVLCEEAVVQPGESSRELTNRSTGTEYILFILTPR